MIQIIFPSAIIEPPCHHKSLTVQDSSISSFIYIIRYTKYVFIKVYHIFI